MNCIWEIVLKAKEQGYMFDELRFINSDNPSPYTESSFDLINTETIYNRLIEVNPLYRFPLQLGELFLGDVKGYDKTREIFLDAMMHYIAVWDLRSGYDKKEYQALHVLREIENGSYYAFAKEALLSCSYSKVKRIIFYLLDLYKSRDYITSFKRAVKELYPKANIYISSDDGRKIIVFLGIDENTIERKKIDMLCDMFLPLSYKVDVFWNKHFGVVGVDESMIIDNIALY